jgi:hypothetical protein
VEIFLDEPGPGQEAHDIKGKTSAEAFLTSDRVLPVAQNNPLSFRLVIDCQKGHGG